MNREPETTDTTADQPRRADVVPRIRVMQERAAKSGKHGYASVLSDAIKEISRLRIELAKSPQGWTI